MLLTPPTLARYTVGLLIAVAVAFLMWYFRSIVVYILVSALLAIIFKPLVGRLARLRIRGWHLPRLFLFGLVHHLFLPQRRRVVPVDAQSTLP